MKSIRSTSRLVPSLACLLAPAFLATGSIPQSGSKTLCDPHHALVRFAGARVTPESAVFLPDGRLDYQGSIDNRNIALGKERPEARQHELREVLEATVQRKPSPYASAPAVGCYSADAK